MSEGLADLRLGDLRARGSETRSNPSLCKQKCVYTSLFGARALAIPLPRHRMHQGAEAVPAVTSSRGEIGSGHRVPLGARIAGCRQHDPHSGVHPPPTQQRSGIWCHGRPHLGKADSCRSKAPCGGRKPKGCQRHVSTHGQCPRMRNHQKKKTLLEATRAPAPWHAPGTVGHIAVVAKGAKGIQDVTTTYHDGGMGSCNPSETNQLGKKKRIGIPGPRVAQSHKSSNRLSACVQSTSDLRRLPRDWIFCCCRCTFAASRFDASAAATTSTRSIPGRGVPSRWKALQCGLRPPSRHIHVQSRKSTWHGLT